jgi:trimeric autotransporter adhesin
MATIRGTASSDLLTGGSGADRLEGLGGEDTLIGGAGNDTLDGGGDYRDRLLGGSGDDTYLTGHIFSRGIVEAENGGIDTVFASGTSFSLASLSHVENLTLLGTKHYHGWGNSKDNVIIGNVGDNTLDGYDGNDKLAGGFGRDELDGGAGNDFLDGGVGGDSMAGGDGDDTYIVDIIPDVSHTVSNWDSRHSNREYTAATGNFDVIAFDFDSDTVADTVRVTYDEPYSDAENHSFSVEFSTRTLGVPFSPGIYADAEGDLGLRISVDGLFVGGDRGSFTVLDVKFGPSLKVKRLLVDFMNGGEGDLEVTGTLRIKSMAGDTISEQLDGGTDTVWSTVSYLLPPNVENLLLGGDAINGIGNAAGNAITGNALDNALEGHDGADTLVGGRGDDTLAGGDGADRLDGGKGNDVYVVGPGDTLVDRGGTDTVIASFSYTLRSAYENLTLAAVGNINGTGNSGDNVIIGNEASIGWSSGDNQLFGKGGDDTIYGVGGQDTLDGGDGDDLLTGGRGGDFLIGGAGNDTLDGGEGFDVARYADDMTGIVVVGGVAVGASIGTDHLLSIEGVLGGQGDDILAGAEEATFLDGSHGDDSLSGGGGNDTLVGGFGNDTLAGGSGIDTLEADEGDDHLVISNDDFLYVFGGSGVDTLALDGPGFDLDLTAVDDAWTAGIEVMDLNAANGLHKLTLSLTDLLYLSDTDSLTVEGGAADSVEVTTGEWTDGGIARDYHVYRLGAAELKINTAITSIAITLDI